MACVCVGGGGGCSVSQTTVQEYLAAFGYSYNASDPLADTYQSVIAQIKAMDAIPASESPSWDHLAEACMRARALLYCSNSPGDCNVNPNTINTAAASDFQTLGVVGQVGKGAISAGGAIAGAAGLASGALLSGVTLGAGIVLTAILDIEEHHAQAEATQAQALCKISPQISASIYEIDSAVLSGTATAEQGIASLKSLAIQFRASVQSLTKSCNAFCGYAAIADAIAAVSTNYYTLATSSPAVVASAITSKTVVSASSLLSSIPVWLWAVVFGTIVIVAAGEE